MAVPLMSGGHPPQGRPTQGLAGDCPKDQRAPTPGLGRPRILLTPSAPTCPSWTLAVTCPRSCVAVVLVWGLWLIVLVAVTRVLSHSLHFSSLFLFAKGCLPCRLVSNSTLLGNDVCLHLPWLRCFPCSLVVSTAQRKKSNQLVL